MSSLQFLPHNCAVALILSATALKHIEVHHSVYSCPARPGAPALKGGSPALVLSQLESRSVIGWHMLQCNSLSPALPGAPTPQDWQFSQCLTQNSQDQV